MDVSKRFFQVRFDCTRRYANHKDGKKYHQDGSVLPQEKDALVSIKAQSARIFKEVRDRVAYDPEYVRMRKLWRTQE